MGRGPDPSYTAQTGATFNNPRHADSQQQILDRIVEMTDNAPSGSTIRIATLAFDAQDPADALVRAYRRGVNVQVVMPRIQSHTDQVRKVRRNLGTNIHKDSYYATCRKACYGPTDTTKGEMHAKVYLFSQTGLSKDVTTVSSANLTVKQAQYAWNDAYTTTDPQVYDAMRSYVNGLRFDHPRPFERVVSTPTHKMWFFPRDTSQRHDYFRKALNNTRCNHVMPGTDSDGTSIPVGKDGRTVLRFTSSLWRGNRKDVVSRLGQLVENGCDVRVLILKDNTGGKILRRLHRFHIPTHFGTYLHRKKIGIHSKLILISGKHYGDPSVNTVYTASVNPSAFGSKFSDDEAIRVRNDRSLYVEYRAQFQRIWRHTPRLTGKQARRSELVSAGRFDGPQYQ